MVFNQISWDVNGKNHGISLDSIRFVGILTRISRCEWIINRILFAFSQVCWDIDGY